MRKRQRAQQDGVDDGEDGGVRPDAERQCQDGRKGEGWPFPQRTHGVAHVLRHVFDRPQALLVAIGLGGCLKRAHLESCLAARLGQRQSGADVLLGEQRHVLRQFLSDTIGVSGAEHGGPHPVHETPQSPHPRSSAFAAMKRSISAVVSAHSCVSARSRRRPPAVSR